MQVSSRKRVVVFVASLGSGGAERVAARVCGWLRDAGHEVCLLTLADTASDFYPCPERVQRHGLDLLAPSSSALRAIIANVRRWRAVRGAITAHQADVVLSLGNRSNVLMLLASIGIRCRKLISERADPERPPLSRGWALLRRLSYPFATLHVSQSTYASNWMAQRFPALPCRVIGNAGDASRAAGPEPRRAACGSLRIIAVGRLSREKGIDLLLEAVAQARHHCTVLLELAIIGEGEDLGALQAQAARLGLSALVRFAGRVQDVPQQLLSADVFILPSRWEGFPNAMIEAMSLGLPVIAARCRGGVEDILGGDEAQCALGFPPEDVAALAACIVRIAGDASLRQQLGRRAWARAADYSPTRIATAWCQVVERP